MPYRPLLLLFTLLTGVWSAEGRLVIDLGGPGWSLWHDAQAPWKDDVIVPPQVDLAALPVRPPTGGWEVLDRAPGAVPCAIPGTVEEYLGDGGGPESVKRLWGVSWFWRDLDIPPAAAGKRLTLEFGGVRQRAEVFLNQQLVGYDVVGMTPFTCAITAAPGRHRLAVRITNPGGRYDWMDEPHHDWGKHRIPMGRAFGGFVEGLQLVARDDVALDDLWVRNTPEPRAVVVTATVANPGTATVTRTLRTEVQTLEGVAVVPARDQTITVPPGGTTVEIPVTAPQAALWDLDQPVLHQARVTVLEGARVADAVTRRFGFRWFAPEGVGSDAVFRLNGKRIMVRTAISWGFWPITGLYPTPAMAERQVRIAKELGLNMLNFHRSPGHPIVLAEADRQGLLYYQEPGGYVSVGDDPVGQALARERLLRLVKRDRSHPSLVIHNMINEGWFRWGADKNPALFAVHRADLQAAHALDPSRTMVYTSAWLKDQKTPMAEDPAKMHLRPYDSTVHMNGWFDHHRAGGPMVYRESAYQHPEDFYARTTNTQEIVFHGEEGAMSSPPLLGSIVREVDAGGRQGWDGAVYRQWHDAMARFLDAKGLRGSWPTVDAFCRELSKPSFEHQGRKILLSRINDPVDGYAVNGWEAELIENHSGIVDCFRHPKGDPALMAERCRPVLVAVMPRALTLGSPGTLTYDVFLVNERRLAAGAARLRVVVTSPDGRELAREDTDIAIAGGEVFGQLLVRDRTVAVPAETTGLLRLTATVLRDGAEVAHGGDEVLAVDWRSQRLPGQGAVVEVGDRILHHLTGRGATVATFDTSLPRRDWIVAATTPTRTAVVPAEALRDLTMVVRRGAEPGGEEVLRRTGGAIAFEVSTGAPIDPSIPVLNDYTVTWEGRLVPPRDGLYVLNVETQTAVTLHVGGEQLNTKEQAGKVTLQAGVPVPLRVELRYAHKPYNLQVRSILRWSLPSDPAQIADLARRCRDEGTTLVLLEGAGEWLKAFNPPGITVTDDADLGSNWVGGQYLAKPHPLFAGLPAGVLGHHFGGIQEEKAARRRVLVMDGEELVVAGYRTWPFKLGTAMGIIPWGKGRIIFSTLNIADRIDADDTQAAVAKRLLGNCIAVAAP